MKGADDNLKKPVVPVFKTFEDFYPFYLTQHSLPHTKLLHFIGTSIGWVFAFKFYLSLLQCDVRLFFLFMTFASGYFWAWLSHFFIEKNKPATFTYPVWSFRGDLHMWSEVLRGVHTIF